MEKKYGFEVISTGNLVAFIRTTAEHFYSIFLLFMISTEVYI